MSAPALLLAANQGIVIVLSMVVIGGLVGAGALGYDVITGFAQGADFGKGLAAGIAIVLLGIMLDRITQGAGTRRRRPIAGRLTGTGGGSRTCGDEWSMRSLAAPVVVARPVTRTGRDGSRAAHASPRAALASTRPAASQPRRSQRRAARRRRRRRGHGQDR